MKTRHALICSYYMPQPDLDSFSRRLFHFVEFLRDAGWAVTCVARTDAGVNQFGSALADMDVPVHVGLDEHVERLVSETTFDIALLGFWYTAERVIPVLRRRSPGTRIIVDSGDLHFLRHARRLLLLDGANDALDALDERYAIETIKELNVYAAADAVFAVSHKEAGFVSDFVGDSERAYFVPDCEELPPSPVPFADRRGMFFVGNFQHQPNVEAVKYLCGDILPQFDPAMLVDHPVYIAGNAMTDALCNLGTGLPFVRMLGWIPSVEPYLNNVRISLVPLLHGAGTKRKIIQALSMGTPTVSTGVGIEGFNLRDGEEVLRADDPIDFANAIARLLNDSDLWHRLARQGRERIVADHSRAAGRQHLLSAIDAVMSLKSRRSVSFSNSFDQMKADERRYEQVVTGLAALVEATVPGDAIVLVTSRGDDALLNLGARKAWHFPRTSTGDYTGYHPKDSEEAIARLEGLRREGGSHLVFPNTAYWWFEHYGGLKRHLESRYLILAHDPACGIIFSLNDPAPPGAEIRMASTTVVRVPIATVREPFDRERRRPQLSPGSATAALAAPGRRPKVLVAGIYLCDRPNNVDDIVEVLSRTSRYEVDQRWASVGLGEVKSHVAAVTVLSIASRTPKFEILNKLLESTPPDIDYLVLCDDDIVLPHGFLDHFLARQSEMDFALAQPALTENSFVNHPLLERQRGAVARETRFVEIGPVVSFHRSIFPAVLPFDLTSPMGWGYEQVWAARLAASGRSMGIIDDVPVDHGMRPTASHYSWIVADQQREALLAKQESLSAADPFRVLAVASTANGAGAASIVRTGSSSSQPRISVVIPTRNRAALLDQSLESLSRQTIDAADFEVIVVDDGSTDATAQVCARWAGRMALTRLPIAPSGIASAKNLGVFAAAAPLILFFDDDDVADPGLLAEHLATHARYPLQNVAVLGYTDWAPTLEVTEVMRYVTDIGHYLFSYTHLADGDRLDFTYFWGGRSSCKKSLLTRTGVFRQQFEFGSEDIELGFRISKLLVTWQLHQHDFQADKDVPEHRRWLSTTGMVVIFNRKASQYMNRAITYDEFCRRCERQGRSQHQFSRMYEDSLVHQWGQTTGALARWDDIRDALSGNVARVHQLEETLRSGITEEERARLLPTLHHWYRWTFDAFKTKGIVEAMAEDGQ